MKALFIGDINVDIIMGGLASLPAVDREVTCDSYTVAVGSPVVIAACAYAGLGGRCGVLGLAGRDANGDFVLREISRRGVETRLVRRTERVATGVTVNLIHGSTRTQITYPGTIAAFDGSWIAAEVLAEFGHVHMAGVYLQTSFRPRITGLLEMCRSRGITASMDPQWDPRERWAYMDEWLPLLDVLFVNEAEALSLTRRDRVEDAVEELNRRAACAAVKAGPRGSFAWIGGTARRIPVSPVDVVDTTGAGDTFDAAFLFARLERRMPLEEACRFANRIAGLSCCHVGGVRDAGSPAEDSHPEDPQAPK